MKPSIRRHQPSITTKLRQIPSAYENMSRHRSLPLGYLLKCVDSDVKIKSYFITPMITKKPYPLSMVPVSLPKIIDSNFCANVHHIT